ncbi:MAG TPA: L,D-transpeptidase family protein, partial [Gemmatimonadaceae bacterium]|nr:L,D-transpeptidase family protein [Gemmatimonadaceae bacterium]
SSAAPAAARAALAPNSVDSVVVEKAARRLTLYVADQPARVYRVALGKNPVGPKRVQGDSRTPEGLYAIDRRNPTSKYYRSLHISYPNAVDRFLAAEKGLTAGGDVMVHGLSPEHANLGQVHWKVDWTEGCVAISNEEMMEMWEGVADGTPIRIKP